jgi:PST family polysaccharide transporter
MLLYCTHIWIHLSIGRADRWFRWGLVDMVVTTVFLLVGLHWHAEGIAVAWVVSYWIITMPALWYAGKPIQLGIPSMIAVIWRYVLASALAGSATFLIRQALPSMGAGSGPLWALGRIVVVTALFAALYLALVILLHRGCAPLNRLARLLREMTSRGELSASAPGSEQVVLGYENSEAEVLVGSEISNHGLSNRG